MSKRINPKKLIEPPGHTLHRLVMQRMEERSGEDYNAALLAVAREPENWPIIQEYQNWGRRLSGHE